MTTNYEKIATLYHYCFEFQNQLRPILNTKQMDRINHKHFNSKLIEFKNIIDDVLETPKVEVEHVKG